MKVGVLGLGAGGLSLAFEAANKGFEVFVTDLPQFMESVHRIIEDGGIACNEEGTPKFAQVTGVLTVSEVIDRSDIVFVVTPAFGTKSFAEACKPFAKAGQKYVICPGSSGGALEFKKIVCDDLFNEDIIVAETHTLPYAARKHGPASVSIHHYVDTLVFASIPSEKIAKITDLVKNIWGDKVVAGKNVLETLFINGNPVIHPAVTLCNTALIERTGGNFKFYAEGITNGVADLMEAVDRERLALAKAVSLDLPSEPQMSCNEGYISPDQIDYRHGYNQSEAFSGIMAQNSLKHRFLTEDAGYGLVLWSSLGKILKVETPTCNAVIQIISVLLGENLVEKGLRTAETFGLTSDNICKL